MRKKLLFCLLAVLGIVSCNNKLEVQDLKDNISDEKGSQTYQANEEEAISSAIHFFNGMKGKSRSKPASLHGSPLNWSVIRRVTTYTDVYSAAAILI